MNIDLIMSFQSYFKMQNLFVTNVMIVVQLYNLKGWAGVLHNGILNTAILKTFSEKKLPQNIGIIIFQKDQIKPQIISNSTFDIELMLIRYT
jgi:hypothetical protein